MARRQSIPRPDGYRLWSLLAGHKLYCDLLALLQRDKARVGERGSMDEHILAAVSEVPSGMWLELKVA